MKQPKVWIKTFSGQEFGTHDVLQMHWRDENITCILVDFPSDRDGMAMTWDGKEFRNSHGNLIGMLIDKEAYIVANNLTNNNR
jgi:hypothetical protein